MSIFLCKLDCIISKFEGKTEWFDFSFVKVETQIHSLPAGGSSSLSLISGVNTHALLVLISLLLKLI